MTLIAAPILIDGPAGVGPALARAEAAADAGAALLEWRVDLLATDADGPAAIRRLVADSPRPCIVTCRSEVEGGQFSGDADDLAELLTVLVDIQPPPRYVDVELAMWSSSAVVREAVEALVQPDDARAPAAGADADAHIDGGSGTAPRREPLRTGLILSSHDFNARPRDLLQRIERMTAEPLCRVIKIAWTARSLRDNLEAFDLLAERRKPTIALCMGRFGLMSRVLAPKLGGLLTFAADSEDGRTAPGQPTIRDLTDIYDFRRIGRETRVYGVIGWPVEHSLSPALHNRGFHAVGHDGLYLPMPVPPEWEHFKATVGAMIDHNRLDFRGASVTIPHKAHLLRFVQERGGRTDALTEHIGAANTLVVGSAGGLSCTNTDCPAAMEALCEGMGVPREALAGRRIAVLGAGGVARAIIVGLLEERANIVIVNRNRERAEALTAGFAHLGRVTVGGEDDLRTGGFDAIINATPVGMTGGPAPDGSPLTADVPLDESVTVMDAVYAPVQTPLIRQARAAGARTVTGTDMFVRQAALQFRLWTGLDLPAAVR